MGKSNGRSHKVEKDISTTHHPIHMEKRSMPVCFSKEQYEAIQEFAKRNGMLSASQALEKILG
ncbi:MAG: hypothetical protein D9C04_07285 [Nitrosopumilus sp. B06]|nr:MAG: hypothetical protein EB828_04735 [Nitrosopumilus sp. D6]RNJ78445.1 MAG: hypothetical protein D9C04_07285 [Nitrosopumilus sp. B06]